MSAFDIRASDKGPGKARPPRTKQPRSGGSGGGTAGDGGTSRSGCFLWTITPPVGLVLFAMSLLAAGAVR